MNLKQAGIGLVALGVGIFAWKKVQAQPPGGNGGGNGGNGGGATGKLIVSDLQLVPSSVDLGQEITASCTARNTGTADVQKAVTVGWKGGYKNQTVTLGPGESKVVVCTFTPTMVGTGAVDVSVDGINQLRATYNVFAADVHLSWLTHPGTIAVGKSGRFALQVYNMGNVEASYSVEMHLTKPSGARIRILDQTGRVAAADTVGYYREHSCDYSPDEKGQWIAEGFCYWDGPQRTAKANFTVT